MGISPLGDSFAPSSDVRSSQETRSGQVEQAQQAQLERQDRSREAEAGQGRDSFNLSTLGAEVARSLASESAQEIRRVDELQQAVNNGTLSASNQETAARVVDEALRGEPAQSRPGVERPASPV